MISLFAFTALEPLALTGNIRMAVAIIYGIFLGILIIKCGFSDRVEVKENLTFKSMKMVRILLFSAGLGMIVFVLLKNFHIVQSHYPQPGFWSVLAGGIIMGIGLGWNGLVPLTAVSALASGRLYAVWSIVGMALAVPAAALIRNNCGNVLAKFNAPLNDVLNREGSFWSWENPALWVAGTALLLFAITACFGTKESK
ncbi:MAG: YeeE/YedE family protein [Lentisphaeria bacterium]|nr:YeeE/YedE family protein [Lentisphaeria bacterium]